MFSRLGVFIGCEGECREALIAGELEGVLLTGKASRMERTGCQAVSVTVCLRSSASGRGPTMLHRSAVARLHRRLCWAAVGFVMCLSSRDGLIAR